MAPKKTVKRTVTTRTSKKPASGAAKKETGTAKKTAGKSSAKKPTTEKKAVSKQKESRSQSNENKELIALLPELDNKEISWLLTQARTIIYNHKVEEVNEAAKNLVDAKNRTGQTGKEKSSQSAPRPDNVAVEQTGNGKSFVIIFGSKRLFISLKELKELVKMSQLTDDPVNASKRLYSWMNRERSDMVKDAAISGPGDPRLPPLFLILREKFTVG